jgi:hydroxyacylglutathione hydrolase
LAQGAYFIESDGEAAIIDPLREVQPYLDRAKEAEADIKYIFETHFHADFVSGHSTLPKRVVPKLYTGLRQKQHLMRILLRMVKPLELAS